MLYACNIGSTEILQTLLQYGATIDSYNCVNDIDLFAAAMASKNRDVIKLVIESDPTHFLTAKTVDGESSLHIACQMGASTGTVQWLVDTIEDKNIVDKYKRTSLHHAVIGGNASLIRILVNAGTTVDLGDERGNTALHLAIGDNNDHIIKLLLEAKASPYIPSSDKSTALHIASARDNDAVLSQLLKFGKDLNTDPRVLNLLDLSGNSPLHIATLHYVVENVQLLLEAGASLSTPDSTGKTVLHLASAN